MSRRLLSIAGVALALGLLTAYAAFSIRETERRALAAAEAQGRALLLAVSAGVEKSLAASRAVESLLADRFLDLGRDLDPELAAAAGREGTVLSRFAARHRIKSALFLDSGFRVVARADLAGPAPAAALSPVGRTRLQPMVAEDLVRKVRAAGLPEKEHVVVFGENRWGTRVDFLLGLRLPQTGGFLFLRHDAEELRAFRREAGIERLLADAAASEFLEYLIVEGRDGTPLLAVGRATGDGVIELRIDTDWEGYPPATLRAGLVDRPVRAVIERGRDSIVLFTAIVFLIAAGGATGLGLVVRSRRRREAVLQRQIREQEKTASMGRLAAGVAHEIRGPLNAIGMAAQRLERTSRDAEPDADLLREIIPSVRREVARLDRTVSEFLDLGRPRALSPRPVDLTALIRDVVRDEAPDATVEAPATPGDVRVDPDEMRKAIANLLRNAREAAGEGPVAIGWRRRGREVLIEVRDGGPGIPVADRERIFEYFFTGRPDGTGLGLGIVRSVVARHGGRIAVDQAPEGGARFTVRLPDER